MSHYYIRRMEFNELSAFYEHIVRDFSKGEYAPYNILFKHIQNGAQSALVFCEGKRDLAYSIITDNHDNLYVLLSLLAVFENCRGRSIGSAFIKALHELYNHKQAILVEVERPDQGETQEEVNFRKLRIRFYKKAGFYLIDGVDYSIWDIPMHLMALPLVASKETINSEIGKSMYDLYLSLMGDELIHKMQFTSLSERIENL